MFAENQSCIFKISAYCISKGKERKEGVSLVG